jgi:hypothetical protein
MSVLKPEISIPAALALGVAVYGIFQVNLPSVTEVRAADMDNQDVASAERAATWEAAGLVATLSLIAKDPTIFLVGGAITVGLAWKYRHANAVSPLTGKATGNQTGAVAAAAQMPGAPAPTTPVPAAMSVAGPSYDAMI